MKGWKTPPNTVYVGRGSKWGNPHRVTEEVPASEAVAKFRASCGELSSLARSELKGKNLSCWCALENPCHADVLLEWAASR